MTAFRKQGLKVSLGVGGWNEGSTNYSLMASSPDRRKMFIASTVEFLKCVHRNIFILIILLFVIFSLQKVNSSSETFLYLLLENLFYAMAMIYDLI